MRRGIVFTAVIVLSLFLGLFSEHSTVEANEESLWSGGFSAEVVEESRDFKYGHPCESKEVKDVFKNPRNLFGEETMRYQDRTIECGFYTDFGFTDGNRYVLREAQQQFVHDIRDGNTALTRHYPNNIFIRLTSATSWTGLTYYTSNIFNEIPDHHINVGNGSILSKKLSDINSLSDKAYRIQFANNYPMQTRTYNVSENGRYIVFMDYAKGVFVHDTATKTYKTVSLNKPKGVGNIAVSNDGNTILHYNSALLVYDATNCLQKFSAEEYVSTATFSDEGCEEISLMNGVQEALGNVTIIGMENSYVHPRDAYIQGIFTIQDNATFTRFKKAVRITPANAPEVRGYLAMGDSFSSGEGDLQGSAWYEPGTDEHGDNDTFLGRNLCHVSRRSYPYLLAKRLGFMPGNESTPISPNRDGDFHSVACSGAVIHNVVGGSLYGEDQSAGRGEDFAHRDNQYRFDTGSLLEEWQQGVTKQLFSINGELFAEEQSRVFNPEVITLGISGNNAGFGEKVEACAMPGTCPYAVAGTDKAKNVALELANLKHRLTDTYRKVKSEAPESTRIYVHGYPNFIDASGEHPCKLNTPFDAQEVTFISESISYLNAVVKAAAQEAGVFYVDVSNALQGYELCSGVNEENSMMNGATSGNDINNFFFGTICYLRSGCLGNESFHPTPRGHEQYASAIQAQTSNLTANMPSPSPSLIPLPSDFYGRSAQIGVEQMNVARLTNEPLSFPLVYSDRTNLSLTETSSALEVFSRGFAPNSLVTIEVHSEPIVLGSFLTDENGILQTDVTVPEWLEPGYHEMHILGTDAYGQQIDSYTSFYIGINEGDFDGDGILDEVDSCPVLVNARIDADNDGIDDVCDPEIVATANESQEEQDGGEVHGENTGLIKGEPSEETVAGTAEELVEVQGEVLGTSTDDDGESLSKTGQAIATTVIIGLGVIISGIIMRRKPAIYYAKEKNKKISFRR